jgi:hypothetical protein
MHFPKIYNTYFVAIIATVSGILSVFPITSTTLHSHRNRFGFDISSMSAIVGTNQYLEYFDNPHGIIQGSIGSALAAGSVDNFVSLNTEMNVDYGYSKSPCNTLIPPLSNTSNSIHAIPSISMKTLLNWPYFVRLQPVRTTREFYNIRMLCVAI